MKERLLKFIEHHALLQGGERVLLAVSGGMDSTVLCYLFREAEIPFGIAHCNFGLRGQESDEDAAFVEGLAQQWKVPFFSQSFQTKEYAKEHRLSVQMAARELRYQWFDTLMKQESYDLMATGHHLDDQVETFFINLMRGSGLAGLRGIPVRQGKIIRPMLFLSRKEIHEYIIEKDISYREDSSNASQYYYRNKIRQQLIPLLRKLQPGLSDIMAETFDKLKDAEEILQASVEAEKKRLLKPAGDVITIDLISLKALKPVKTYLHYFLKEYGFTNTATENLAECLDLSETRIFYSENYRLTKDRNQVLIEPLESTGQPEKSRVFQIPVPVGASQSYIQTPLSFRLEEPIKMQFSIITRDGDFILIRDEEIAQIDFDSITWPLTIRPWEQGDQFHPLGMRGKKKISDYFIDEKFSPAEKRGTWLLCSGQRIMWLIGKRLDENFKIKSSTKRILRIELL